MKFIELFGWGGVVMIVGAYALVTLGALEPESLSYIWLNILGSIGIIISSYTKRDFQPVALNVIWLIVAIAGLILAL